MRRWYSAAEMERTYQPGETMTFARGRFVMTVETARRFAYGLVVLDRETGMYRRASFDPGLETMTINEAKLREQMRTGNYRASRWVSSRR